MKYNLLISVISFFSISLGVMISNNNEAPVAERCTCQTNVSTSSYTSHSWIVNDGEDCCTGSVYDPAASAQDYVLSEGVWQENGAPVSETVAQARSACGC